MSPLGHYGGSPLTPTEEGKVLGRGPGRENSLGFHPPTCELLGDMNLAGSDLGQLSHFRGC